MHLMRNTSRVLIAAALTVFTGACTSKAPVWQIAGLPKCQLGIEAQTLTLRRNVSAALKFCNDGYRKAFVANLPLTGPATKCQTRLSKVLNTANTSGVGKALAKLNGLATNNTCTPSMLTALGHLPTVPFGDWWARMLVVGAIQAAVEDHLAIARDTPAALQAFQDTGTCPVCANVKRPPCEERSCRLGAASEWVLKSGSPSPNSFPLTGSLPIGVCRYQDVLGSDLGVLAQPSRLIDPITLSPGVKQCFRVLGAEGYVTTTLASPLPAASTSTCVDHLVDAPDSDECPASLASPFCADATFETIHSGTFIGGPCLGMTTGSGTPGTSFVIVSASAKTDLPGNEGPDGAQCTTDDVDSDGEVFPIALTTGSATAVVLDAGATDGGTITLSAGTGAPFVNAVDESLSGGTLVGAVPQPDAGSVGDVAASIKLVCQ